MLHVIELSAAQQHIEPIKTPLIDGTKAGVAKWAELVEKQPDLAYPLDATARANYIHCHIRPEIERRVEGLPEVEVNDRLDFFALKIGPSILLRLKYVGHGEPSNVQTEQQRLLARQQYDQHMTLALNGDLSLAPPTLLTCGYTLEGHTVGRIEIRRDCIGHLTWNFDIYGGDALTEPYVFDGMADVAKPAAVRSARRKGQQAAEENQA